MVGGWWLVVGGWWLVVGGWWLVVGGWWLVVGGWWLVVGGMKLKGRAQVGDMSDFEVKRPYDSAFNTINSFRHLPTEEAAVGHLESSG